MNSLLTKGLTLSLALCLVAGAAVAAPTIGVYYDTAATETAATVRPYEMITMHVILTTMEDQVNGVEYTMSLPSTFVVVSRNYGGSNPIILPGTTSGNAIGFGDCMTIVTGTPVEMFIVETLTGFTTSNFEDESVTLTKYGHHSANGAAGPRYSSCAGAVNEMSVSNASITAPVATDAKSWSSVKALFD